MYRSSLVHWFCLASLGALLPLILTSPAVAQVTVETVHRLPSPGSYPSGQLLKAADGTLFGMAYSGGVHGWGTIFKYSPDGQFSKIHDFNGKNGTYPSGYWVVGRDGNYYGTTSGGGENDAGTLFRLTPAGAVETVAQFKYSMVGTPHGQFLQAADGSFYGTGYSGGAADGGAVWKVSPSGALSIIAEFGQDTGKYPGGGLTAGPDGAYYGTTTYSGQFGGGSFFKVRPTGGLTVFAHFGGADLGSGPAGPLILAADGNFYGTTRNGGVNSYGTVFRATPEGVVTTIAKFHPTNGTIPIGGLIAAPGGGTILHGTALYGGLSGGGTIFSIDIAATEPAFTVEANFTASEHGMAPRCTLTYDAQNRLVGVTQFGGASSAGTLFRAGDSLEALHHFGDPDGSNLLGLTLGPDGELYGTSYGGGAGDRGTMFRISTTGTFTKLADFGLNTTPPNPSSALIAGDGGTFFGVAYRGGLDPDEGYDIAGILFQATTSGEITTLASFVSSGEETRPLGLMRASDGNLYINAYPGGADAKDGAIFRYAPGSGLNRLYNFSGTAASEPLAPLVEGADGKLYGTTASGDSDRGSFFRISTDGAFTSLARFSNGSAGGIGGRSQAPLLQRPDGSFYGTSMYGGKFGIGSIFKATANGTLSTFATFDGYSGAFLSTGLIQGPGGALFGTAPYGGTRNGGTIFRVSTSGKVTVLADLNDQTGSRPEGTLMLGSDGNLWGTTRTTIFRIAINNRPPIATDDTLVLPVYNAKVTANDSDPDGDALTITSTSTPAHGTVRINPDNTITYIPGETFPGTDTFTYTVSDGMNGIATATVTVTAPENLKKASAGTYSGVLTLDGVPLGFASVQANGKGSLSASLTVGRQKFTFKAPIPADGTIHLTIPQKKLIPEIAVNLRLDPATNSLTGTVKMGDQVFTVELSRTFPIFTKKAPNPHAGSYTVLLRLPPASANSGLPEGTGYAVASVTAAGQVKLVGKLPDGTAFSFGSLLSHEGEFPFYAAPYKKKDGYVGGKVAFAEEAVSDFAGGLLWQLPQREDTPSPSGPQTLLALTGARFTPPAPRTTVAPFVAEQPSLLIFENSELSTSVTISERNKVTIPVPPAEKMKLKITSATGLFTGSFLAPGTRAKTSFGGVIYQKGPQPGGEGLSPAEGSTERVRLQPKLPMAAK